MKYTQLGRTGLKVSRLCLGTMNFGPQTSEDDSFAVMDRAHEHGINFFDTADVYGWKKGEGITEQIIGRWFAQGDNRREKTVLATKLYGEMGDWPNQSRVSALNIKRACEASLRRMQTDYIDLYQMHHIDRARRGKKSGRRWKCWCSKAKCCTLVRRTLPAGTSRRPMKPLKHATSSALSANRASIT
jgi:aryl-alcohol dehydrogenase-like predicted oxidoreductase